MRDPVVSREFQKSAGARTSGGGLTNIPALGGRRGWPVPEGGRVMRRCGGRLWKTEGAQRGWPMDDAASRPGAVLGAVDTTGFAQVHRTWAWRSSNGNWRRRNDRRNTCWRVRLFHKGWRRRAQRRRGHDWLRQRQAAAGGCTSSSRAASRQGAVTGDVAQKALECFDGCERAAVGSVSERGGEARRGEAMGEGERGSRSVWPRFPEAADVLIWTGFLEQASGVRYVRLALGFSAVWVPPRAVVQLRWATKGEGGDGAL